MEGNRLSKNYFWVRLIGSGIFWGLALLAVVFAVLISGYWSPWWVPTSVLGGWFLFAATSIFFTIKGYYYASYLIRDHDVVSRKGYLFREELVVPFNRIQHVELNEGPIEQLFDLSTLRIYTAGGSASDLSIAGLEKETGEALKTFILKKAGQHGGR